MKERIEKRIEEEKQIKKEALDKITKMKKEIARLENEIKHEEYLVKIENDIIEKMENELKEEYQVITTNTANNRTSWEGFDNLNTAKKYARRRRQQAMPWVEISIVKNDKLVYQVVSEAFEIKFLKEEN